jgi:hypothetical protein
MKVERLVPGLVLILGLGACGDDDTSPTASKSDMLVGTWYLQSTEGDSDVASLVSVSYLFESAGRVRQRVGGKFLQALRETEAIRAALEGEDLSSTDRIDGANMNWVGDWTLAGDSLHVTFDLLIVEVFGDVPILGKVTVPVFDQILSPSEQMELNYTCDLSDGVLSLRGSSVAVGVGANSQQVEAQIEGAPGQLAQQAADLLWAQIEGLDTQRYVRR